jgi:hypothetical protein
LVRGWRKIFDFQYASGQGQKDSSPKTSAKHRALFSIFGLSIVRFHEIAIVLSALIIE